MLGLGQARRHLLAQQQLAHKHQGQPQAAQHQHYGKAAQHQGAAPPLGQDGVGGLGHVQDQRIVAHGPKGIQALNPVKRRHTDERTRALGLEAHHVRSACDGFANVGVSVGKARYHHPVLPEQVNSAVGAQIQRTKQFVEIAQPNHTHHHPGKTAIGMKVRARDGQDVEARHPRRHGFSKKQPFFPVIASGLKVIAVRKVGPPGHEGARVQNDVALRIQHQHVARAPRAQRIVKHQPRAQVGGQGPDLGACHLAGHAFQGFVKRIQRPCQALLQGASQVGVGLRCVAPLVVANGPDGARKQRTNAQSHQQGQPDQAVREKLAERWHRDSL